MTNISIHYLFFISFCLTILSCQQEIEIDMPRTEPKIVINALISPWSYTSPNPLNVYIEKSTQFTDSVKNNPVLNALVGIYHADSLVAEIAYIDTLGYYTSYSGSTINIPVLKAGASYRLVVDINDTIFEAEDIIPYKTEIKSIQVIPFAGVNENNFIFSKITINFYDDIELMNYYEIQLITNGEFRLTHITSDDPVITTEPSYPSNISIGSEPPKYLLFNDNTFNGKEKSVSFYYVPPNSSEKDSISAHFIELRFLSISEKYYRFKSSWIIQNNNQNVDILYGQAEPINVYSNIQGGYGIFACYNSNDRTFIINNNEIIDE